MARILFTVVLVGLTVVLVLVGCAPPDSQTERSGGKQKVEKAAKEGRQAGERPSKQPRQEDSEPQASGNGAKKEEQEGSGQAKPVESPEPAPEDVLASQYRHINAANYGAAYDLFDDQSQRLVSLEQYSAYFTSAFPYEIASYSFPAAQVMRPRYEGQTASVVADLVVSSSSREDQYRVTQKLVREGESWRVVMRDEQVASFIEAQSTVTVSRVVDGDTIEISPAVDGNEEVRLIGMDTPETKNPSEGIEPLGPEASSFAADELTGQGVGLEFDVEQEDQYGRLLAYVYLDGEMFNEVLVEEGYAQAYPYEPNTRYEGRFAAAQREARAAGLGIWGLTLAQQCQLADRGNGIGEGTPGCSGASASASSSATASSSSSASAGAGGSAPTAPNVGGDIDCAQVNGPIPTPPGDPDGLDGDGDGLACE